MMTSGELDELAKWFRGQAQNLLLTPNQARDIWVAGVVTYIRLGMEIDANDRPTKGEG